MTKFIKELLVKYKMLISYVFWGVCTTAINIIVYTLCYNVLKIENVPSNIIAWILAVAFAYITNKLYVFDSKSFEPKLLLKEITSFFSCRFLTGVMDVVIMYYAVDVFMLNATVWKILSNILVIILNFIFGKLLVFRK